MLTQTKPMALPATCPMIGGAGRPLRSLRRGLPILLGLAAAATPLQAGVTTSFADLPDGVFVNLATGNPTGPFGPFDFDFGGGHVVTATLVAEAMSCPDNIGSHGEPLTIANDPAIDPGDHLGRVVVNTGACPNQTITLDFSAPVSAVGVTFKHYSCGFLQQGDRTIHAYDGLGGTGNLIGTVSTQGFAHPCFNIWLDFVGVISANADIRSLVIDADADETLLSGLAASPGAAPPCEPDVNGDSTVDVFDLLVLLGGWGPCDDPGDCESDLNGDDEVNVFDLLALLGSWGACP